MITYEPFYRTLKEREISTYRLINQYGISRSLLDRLKHNKPTFIAFRQSKGIANCFISKLCPLIAAYPRRDRTAFYEQD